MKARRIPDAAMMSLALVLDVAGLTWSVAAEVADVAGRIGAWTVFMTKRYPKPLDICGPSETPE